MITKTFSPNVRTIILNDIKRQWVIPFMGLLALFFSSSYSILLAGPDESVYFIKDVLEVTDFGGIVVSMLLPIFAGVCVFRYLHTVSSVTAYHSLPISRTELFAGHYIAGYLFCTAPVILNSVILMLLARPEMDESIDPFGETIKVNIFTVESVVVMMLMLLMIMLVVYSLTVLAGMFCGTTLLHVGAALGLNFMIPAISLFLECFAEKFLIGYAMPESVKTIVEISVPYLGIRALTAGRIVIYLAYSLIATGLALFFYKKRPLENAAEPLAFSKLIPFAAGLLTIAAATLNAELFEGSANFFLGLAVGAIVIYLPCVMLVTKTTRVFNRRVFRNGAITLAVLALIVAGFIVDPLGYENHIPKTAEVKSVTIEGFGVAEINKYTDVDGDLYGVKSFTEEKTIDIIRKMHADFIEHDLTRYDETPDCPTEGTILYRLKNGSTVTRAYSISNRRLEKSKDMKALYESKEFKRLMSQKELLELSDEELMKNISIDLYPGTGYEISLKKGEVRGWLEAIDKDIKNRTYAEAIENSYKSELLGSYTVRRKTETGLVTAEFSLRYTDTHVIKWLQENGYYYYMDPSKFRISKIEIESYDDDGALDKTETLKPASLGVVTLADFEERYPDLKSLNIDKDDFGVMIYTNNIVTNEEYIQYI